MSVRAHTGRYPNTHRTLTTRTHSGHCHTRSRIADSGRTDPQESYNRTNSACTSKILMTPSSLKSKNSAWFWTVSLS
jgi:hypothetical protein